MAAFMSCSSGSDEGGGPESMRDFFSPSQVDQMVRQAIQFAWMSLPKERRTVEQTEAVVRHLFDRALKDFREDAVTFRE